MHILLPSGQNKPCIQMAERRWSLMAQNNRENNQNQNQNQQQNNQNQEQKRNQKENRK